MTSNLQWKLVGLAGRTMAKYHPDGKSILTTTTQTSELKVWTLETLPLPTSTPLEIIDAHEEDINGVCITHDGKRIATYSKDGSSKLWNWLKFSDSSQLAARFDCPITAADFSACDNLLAVGGNDGLVKIIDVLNISQTRRLKAHEGQIKCLAFDPQKRFLATASSDGKIKIFNYGNNDTELASFTIIPPTQLEENSRMTMSWSPNGKALAVPVTSGVWVLTRGIDDTAPWSATIKLIEHNKEALCVAWSPNGRYLASSHVDSSVLLWDFKDKRSFQRQSCPDVPLTLQWSPTSNALLICLANGRAAEWANPVPKNMPHPIKPFDSESKNLLEQESKLQSLDKLFDDEDTSKLPSGPSITAAQTNAQSNTKNSIDPSRHIDNTVDDDITVDVFKRRRIGNDLVSPILSSTSKPASSAGVHNVNVSGINNDTGFISSSKMDTDMLPTRSSSLIPKTRRSFASYEYDEWLHLQPPFMPASTQGTANRKYLSWNHIGSIIARYDDDPETQTSLEFEFTDLTLYKNFSLNKQGTIDLATLGTQGIFMSSRAPLKSKQMDSYESYGTSSKDATVNTLHFQMFTKWGLNSDWTFNIADPNEAAVLLAIGENWCAAITNKRRVRLFGEGGSKLAVLTLPGPAVCAVGHGPLLALLYHGSQPIHTNGIPKSFSTNLGFYTHGHSASQSLGWWVINVPSKQLVSSGFPLPISDSSQVTWMGFSPDGVLSVYDSEHILRQLGAVNTLIPAATNHVSFEVHHANMFAKPIWSDLWLEVLDASPDVRDGEQIWPISVTDSKMRYIPYPEHADGPMTIPRPVPAFVSLDIPFYDTTSKSLHENALIRTTLTLGTSIQNLAHAASNSDGPLGNIEFNSDSTEFIIDASSNQEVLGIQAKLEQTVLRLFKDACSEDRVERALGLAKTLVLKKSIVIAIKIATAANLTILAEKIHDWSLRREAERKRRNAATQRSLRPTSVVGPSTTLQSMDLPVTFDEESFKRKTYAKRPERPSAANSKSPTPKSAPAVEPALKSQTGYVSEEEFEIDDDESEDNSLESAAESKQEESEGEPSPKRFKTQQFDNDDMDVDNVANDRVANGFDLISRTSAKQKEAVNPMEIGNKPSFKSNPFNVAPPFKPTSGSLIDTVSKIGTNGSKAKKSAKATSSKKGGKQ